MTNSSQCFCYLKTFLDEFLQIIIYSKHNFRGSRPKVFCEKGVLRNFEKFTGKHPCQRLFFNKLAGLRPVTLFKKKSLARAFSCEFCKISKNTFFYRTLPVAASVTSSTYVLYLFFEEYLQKRRSKYGFTSAKLFLPICITFKTKI